MDVALTCPAAVEDPAGKDAGSLVLDDLFLEKSQVAETDRKYDNEEKEGAVLSEGQEDEVLSEGQEDEGQEDDVLSEGQEDDVLSEGQEGEEEESVVLSDGQEDLSKQGQALPEGQVSGWNAETGTTIRKEQKDSQAEKSENAAAKKGLGYLCYSSHGAMKPKVQ